MFAGGDDAAGIQKLKTAASRLLCGPDNTDWGLTDPAQKSQCQAAVGTKVDYAFTEVTDHQQREQLRSLLTGWYANPLDTCYYVEARANQASCFSAYFTGSRPIIHPGISGESLRHKAFGPNGNAGDDYVSWAVATVKAGKGAEAVMSLASAKVQGPLTAGLDADKTRVAWRLFYQAMSMIPPDQQIAKAEDVAKAVNAAVRTSPDFRKAYVKDVISSPTVAVTVAQAPEALYDPAKLGFAASDKLPPEAIEELTRLFYEALASFKAQTKTPNDKITPAITDAAAVKTAEEVAKKVATKKEADSKFTIAGLAGLIKPETAYAVPSADKTTIAKVILSSSMVGDVPYELIEKVAGDRLGPHYDYLQQAIREFWDYEAKVEYAKLKDDAAKKKFVDALIAQFNGYTAAGNFATDAPEVAKAHQITLTRLVSVAPDGTPKIENAPPELSRGFSATWRDTAFYRQLMIFFEQAIATDKAKYEGDDKAKARGELAAEIQTRAMQFILYENYGDLTLGDIKSATPRSSVPAMSDFMRSSFGGFREGHVAPLFVPGLHIGTIEAPIGGLKPFSLSLMAEGGVGGILAGEASHNNAGLGFAILGLEVNHQPTSWFRYGARAMGLFGAFPEQLGPASDADPHTWEQGNAFEAAKMYELWGLAAFMPIPQLELAFKGGIIPKRSGHNDYGLEDIVLWYGKDDTLGSSRTPGIRFDPTLRLLDDRLKLFGSLGYATYAGGIDFRGVKLDPNGDEQYAYTSGGHVIFGSLGLDGTIIKDWWRAGARYSGSTVFGADQADMMSGYGQSLHLVDLGTGVLFGGSGHALDFNARLAWLGDERREDAFKWMLGARWKGPDYSLGGTTWAHFQPIVNVNYMSGSATIHSGQDLYGSGSACTSLSCAGGVGNGPTPGGPVFGIPLATRGLEISAQPKFKFRNDGWLSGLFVQPVASIFWSQQGSASGAGSMDPGFFLGVNFGIDVDPFSKQK